MPVYRLYVVLFLCFGLTVLSVYSGVPEDHIVFPESLSLRNQHSSWNSDNEPQPPRRTVRQGNRRPRPPMPPNQGDPFAGLEPQGNNRPSTNQGQWSNQRPNQQQGLGNQNQLGTNSNNQGQNQFGTNGNNQGQNQWGTNGNNQGQNQFGTNGNNQGNRPPTQPTNSQNQLGTNGNNQGQNQFGTNGNNQGNRPPTQPTNSQNQFGTNGNNQGQSNQGNRPPTQPTNSQNQVQTSTTSTNSEEANEEQRNACNATCKERITNEYNPVCGSDSQTYQNRRFLDCVANCGIITEFSYIGTCVTTTQRIPIG